MRMPRQRNDREDTLYQIFNQQLGREGENVLDLPAMRRLRLIVSQLSRLYVVRVMLLQVTADSYGMLVAVPAAPPSRQTVEACVRAHHGRAAPLPDFDDPTILCHWTKRLRDVSEFVKDLQQRFTVWLNRVKNHGQRHGPSWCDRFKSIIIGSAWHIFTALNGSAWQGTLRFGRVRQWQDPRADSAWRRFWDRHGMLQEGLEMMGQLGTTILVSMLSGSASRLLNPFRPRRY